MEKLSVSFSSDLFGRSLCKFALDTVLAKLQKKPEPKFPADCEDGEYPLFVTWLTTANQDLRGCIGTFSANKLSKNLANFAKISAFEDD